MTPPVTTTRPPARCRTRFAPSPTGYLHLGNVRTALLNWLLAKQAGGEMLLRIEDTDTARNQSDGVAAIVEDLAWLGLDWVGADGAAPRPYLQSENENTHLHYFRQLQDGGHAYPCFCAPEDLAAQRQAQIAVRQPPRYAGHCRAIPAAAARARVDAGEPAAWRFAMPANTQILVDDAIHGQRQFASDVLDDFVIRRRDGRFAFFFVNAVDDAAQDITHVLRGDDHLPNTPRQIALLRALGLPTPQYAHMALMVGAGGRPLSKRDGLMPVRQWREQGYAPAALVNYLAGVGNAQLAAKINDGEGTATLSQLAAAFDLAQLSRAPAQFDSQGLTHCQKTALTSLSLSDWMQWAAMDADASGDSKTRDFAAVIRDNVLLRADIAHWQKVIAGEEFAITAEAKSAIAAADPALWTAATAAADQPDWKSFTTAITTATGIKGKNLYAPLRAALTGRLDGPAMSALYPHLPHPTFPAARRH